MALYLVKHRDNYTFILHILVEFDIFVKLVRLIKTCLKIEPIGMSAQVNIW
jgi:hypothetical protein